MGDHGYYEESHAALADYDDPRQHTTRVSEAAHQLAQGEHLDKDRSIIAQSAGKDAAELTKAIVAITGDTDETVVLDIYKGLRLAIFNDTLAVAGAESVVEEFEGEVKSAPRRSSGSTTRRSSGGGGGSNDPGTLEIRNGKHAGKTIAAVYDEDPEWVEWAAANLNNAFLKGKCADFLSAAA